MEREWREKSEQTMRSEEDRAWDYFMGRSLAELEVEGESEAEAVQEVEVGQRQRYSKRKR